jgi:hypothetical protein
MSLQDQVQAYLIKRYRDEGLTQAQAEAKALTETAAAVARVTKLRDRR